jgi:hypothetical protein
MCLAESASHDCEGKKLIILSLVKVLFGLNAEMSRFLVREFDLEKKLDPIYLDFAVNRDLY